MDEKHKSYQNFKISLKEHLLRIEEILYLLISLSLLIVFGLIFVDGFFVLISLFDVKDITYSVVKFLDKILVALIVVELFYTVMVAIVEESAIKCVEPFLLVGVTALVRRLLVLTFEIAHPVVYSAERMTFYLIEMGLIGFLVIVFVIAIYLFRKTRRG
ncbi:MAG: hypothetical protein JHC25_02275 [Thermodesulfobacterium sp.]|nr:hypothetical protein [Thermodesulfobacterium sp.]